MVLSANIQTSSKYFSIFILITIAFFLLPADSHAYIYQDNPDYVYTPCPNPCDNDPGECANGASVGDGHCGSACDGGTTWTKYKSSCKFIGNNELGKPVCEWIRIKESSVCSTGDKCIVGDKGLRPGFCDCSYGSSIYKTCCSGNTAVACNEWSGGSLPSPPEGACGGNTQVRAGLASGSKFC